MNRTVTELTLRQDKEAIPFTLLRSSPSNASSSSMIPLSMTTTGFPSDTRKTASLAAILCVLLSLLAAGRAQAGYEAVVLGDAPVAYWRMDDADGSRVTDYSGNGHHGMVDGGEGSITFSAPGLVPTEPGNGSVRLAGFDRIVVPGFEKIGPTGYSVEYWVRVTSYPEACCDSLVSDGESGGDFFMMNYLLGPGQGDSGGIRPHFSFANAPVALSTANPHVLALGTVSHVVTVWDASAPGNNNARVFINGVEVLAGNVTGNVPPAGDTGDNKVYIGRDDRENRPSHFDIDEVALYDRPLSGEQVKTHYLAGTGGQTTYAGMIADDAPVAYWRLGDEGPGTASDSSGNGNDGTVEDGSLAFGQDSLVPPDTDTAIAMHGDRLFIEGFDKVGSGFSVEFWTRIDSPTGSFANLVGDGDGGLNFMLMVYMTPGGNVRPHVQTTNGFGSLDSVDMIADGQPHHVVSTWDQASGEMALYIDGEEAAVNVSAGQFPTTGEAVNEANPLFIGRDNREPGWNGWIDEVAIYDYALAPDRVRAHFSLVDRGVVAVNEPHPDPGDLAGAPDGLLHFIDFDEAGGTVDGRTLNFAYDRVGTADGSFVGAAGRTAGLVGTGAAVFRNLPGSGVHLGANGFETSAGITVEMLFQSDWTATDYDEFFRKEDGGNRILLSYQADGNNGGANPPVDDGIPVLSFGLNVGGTYGELDMPLDGSNEAGLTVEDLADSNTHHIAATFDSASGEKAIWIDGIKAWSVNLGGGTRITSGGGTPAIIGNLSGGGEPFNGIIDEFAFWDRALSEEEILTHAANGRAGESILTPGRPGNGFVFTAFSFDPGTSQATATFASSPGAVYASEISTDLLQWNEISDSIASAGTETKIVANLDPFLQGARAAFLRVRRIE